MKYILKVAHARRKFETALDNDKVRSGYVLTKIQALYSTERKAREAGYSFEQRKELREQESVQWHRDVKTTFSPDHTMQLKEPLCYILFLAHVK